ncbi:predicted protein [Uncinocarpus reesii 1704]|uniref:DOMON domain-containing protein n=1 Tax=Uncinocarpus reesii (strain UAMH 1704) TaxID=336963 RepID=C4JIZ0_UNCRE|nr:uncharacterized protein UREG_01597 [Uncinocarpus reesii 1704]EEP76748.1 predicted protein [Uncinocarpus reesii 1704]
MRIPNLGSASVALAFVSSALGKTVQYSPGSQAAGITYHVNIPSSTASSKSGPIFFQISAPDDIQWVALGQGTGMEGANVFMLYSASASNVTLSPRLAKGLYQPEVNPKSKISLLDGTGIINGKMVANVRCDNCLSWEGGSMDPTDTMSSWLWAMKRGRSIKSSNVDENLQRHDDKGLFYFDLTQAVGGNSDNPFSDMPSDAPSPSSTGSPGSAPAPGEKSTVEIRRIAHGLIMSIAIVVLFPLFALTVRTIPSKRTVPFIHAPLQFITLCLAIAGAGIGISLAMDLKVISGYHPIIGLVTIGSLLLFQPALGLVQHIHFRRTGETSSFGIIHRWGGRLLLVLGVINGGLGFMFSGIGNPGVPKAGAIAYSVIAGVIGLIYAGIIAVKSMKSKINDSAQVKLDSFNGSPRLNTSVGQGNGERI